MSKGLDLQLLPRSTIRPQRWCGGVGRCRSCGRLDRRSRRQDVVVVTRSKGLKAEDSEDSGVSTSFSTISEDTGPDVRNGRPNPLPPDASEEDRKRVAYFSAEKAGKRIIQEGKRPLAEYMALPVGQYSVLDASRIERLGESIFKCYVGEVEFFGFVIRPIVTVDVKTNNTGCYITMLDCELDGSDIVRAGNERFDARMWNRVTWEQKGDEKRITSDTVIDVAILVPKVFSLVPISIVERVGNSVMNQVLRLSVPRFLNQLDKDYAVWAAGDDSRNPVDS